MKVLVADPLAPEGMESLKAKTEVDVKLGLKPDELKAIIGEYDALIVRSETQVTADVIKCGTKLQIVARAGVGLDNIDVNAATQQGIMVVNAPTGNTVAATEHTMALMLALARNVPQAHGQLKAGKWNRKEYVGVELRNKTLGVIGLGNVGSGVATRAKSFEMRLIGYDPFASEDYAASMGVTLMPLEQLYKEADFITLHLPLTPQTRGMIGEKEIATMKKGVRIINVARGGLIDDEALVKAIEEGRVAGAAVDVYAVEPCTDSILFKNDKIIVTPHLGASTKEAQTNVCIDVVEQIIDVLNGKPARYAVNVPQISPELLEVLRPYMDVATLVGKMAGQLMAGQLKSLKIRYSGEIAQYETSALKAAILSGLLDTVSEEKVNLVNAGILAQQRGLKISEQKETEVSNYASLISLEVVASGGSIEVAGTVLRDETHIVRINKFWLDIVPSGGYFMLCYHTDQPGLIGAVGTITGKSNINISAMQVARLEKRGEALMILSLDEPAGEEHIKQIQNVKGITGVKLVKL
ncbi:MAG: phosphoglycerate dehydrogenase [Dehalococcoidia bacterium]|nr:phosphoglycerate dehydrogenase [Dehalococcoidia bacterium]MDD5494677.1 phosphoglycerate dehydrogenase [Dehalococcoidia bacterium]